MNGRAGGTKRAVPDGGSRQATAEESGTPKVAGSGESLVVDFVANFVAGGNDASFEPVKGRVLMSNRRLVLATSDTRTVIPIRAMYDIAVGQVPPDVEEFFDFTVMVGYTNGEQRRTTVIGGSRETIERFSLLLFRAALNGSKSVVTHPAKVGGRVMDSPRRRARIHLEADAVVFPDNESLGSGEEPFEIDLATVIFFEVIERTIDDEKRLVLSVQHVVDGQTVTTEVSLGSRRKMNILGRYLRQMYFYIKTEAEDVSVSESELEVLVGLYSTGGEADLAALLEIDEAELDARLESLADDELIEGDRSSPSLTSKGRFLVNDEIEGVNM
jgi:helix-turn-helix protein